MKSLVLVLLIGFLRQARADQQAILSEYLQEAKKEDAGFMDFNIDDGRTLYFLKRTNARGENIGCTSCHTQNPKAEGLSKANKIIEPLAPVANSERFTDKAKVEKWFTRNCKEVLDRLCTIKEKGNFIKYMVSLK